MNDIQVKENIYNAATAGVSKQEESLSVATMQVTQLENEYLLSVVRAATLSEKTRRKKDFLVNLVFYGGLVGIALMLFIINVGVGALFIVIVGTMGFLVWNETVNKSVENYNNRKSFFLKYAHVIPESEQLKWKNRSVS